MSFILLTLSVCTPIFADGDNNILSLKIDYPKKSEIPEKSPLEETEKVVMEKKRAIQRAFLVGVLCSMDVDVEIHFNSSFKQKYNIFSVNKIGNSTVPKKYTYDSCSQLKAMVEYISKNAKNIKFNLFSKSSSMICSAKINKYLLNQRVIYEIGIKILEIIQNKRQDLLYYKLNKVNLGRDIKFKKNVSNVLGDLLTPNDDENENTFNFFELPSSSTKLEPITNPVHINYLKKHPENSSQISACYQESFLAAILSTFGINIGVNLQEKTTDEDFPKCFTWLQVGDHCIQRKGKLNFIFLTYVTKYINEIFPAQKFKIETVTTGYSVPTRVTIGNSIILTENDIFNLGQRFYNMIDEMLSKGTLRSTSYYRAIHLQRSYEFIINVKKIFKEYTGSDLPDIRI